MPLKKIKKLESINKRLKDEGTNKSNGQAMFDLKIIVFHSAVCKLSTYSDIVQSSLFESAIVKSQFGTHSSLSRNEEICVSMFAGK